MGLHEADCRCQAAPNKPPRRRMMGDEKALEAPFMIKNLFRHQDVLIWRRRFICRHFDARRHAAKAAKIDRFYFSYRSFHAMFFCLYF